MVQTVLGRVWPFPGRSAYLNAKTRRRSHCGYLRLAKDISHGPWLWEGPDVGGSKEQGPHAACQGSPSSATAGFALVTGSDCGAEVITADEVVEGVVVVVVSVEVLVLLVPGRTQKCPRQVPIH